MWNPNLATFSKLAQSDKTFNIVNGIFNFNLFPNPYQLSKALATLVRENDWKTYTIIYETDDGLIRLQELLKVYNPKDPPVMYRKLGPGPDYRSVLKQIRAKNVLQIILDCKTDNIVNILLQAKEVKLLEEYHAYLLTSLDARTIDFSVLGDIKTNISIINIMNQNGLEKAIRNWELETYQPVQLSSKDIKINTALMYDALNLFINSYSQLDRSEELYVKPLNCDPHAISSHGYPLAAFIAKKNMTFGRLLGPPLSGPIAFNKFGQRSSFQLEIMELKNHKFRVTGTWDSNNPNMINSTITSEDREKEKVQEISGRMFKVVSRIGPPYLMRKPPIEGRPYVGNNRFEGFAMDLIDEICKILNCTYQFEIVPDNNYGSYDPKKKSWNGLIGYLLDRKADLAICDLTTTYERRKAVDFTNPFMTLGISILYAKPNKPPPEILAFTNPLSLDIWLYMATGFIIMSLIIYMAARLNPDEWENPHPCDPNPVELENVWNLKNCFWLTLGSILGQGCDILPKGISTRMVTGMWWFFSMIMSACYTANLAAFLTMERMGPTIKSAEDLASQTKIKYGCVRGGATSSFFKDSNVTTYHKMWVSMESADPSVFEKSNDDGVKRVLSSRGAYAFLMESSTIEYEMARHCELVQVGHWLDTKGYGIAMPTSEYYLLLTQKNR
uniref:IR15 n=1 Tax=Hycleus cichorii TaxID=1270216 RepID=A0A2U9NJC4_9CUCU|nr:IR15 [Hycleus cichorii]